MSEGSGTSSSNPSDSSDEPDVAPGGSVPPTAPLPVQPEDRGEQATQGMPLLPPPPAPAPPSAPEPAGPGPGPAAPAAASDPVAPEPAAQRPHSHRRTGHTVYHTSAVYGGKQEPKPARRRTVAVSLTAGALAVLVVALVLVLTVFKSSNPPPAHGIIPNGELAAAGRTAGRRGVPHRLAAG